MFSKKVVFLVLSFATSCLFSETSQQDQKIEQYEFEDFSIALPAEFKFPPQELETAILKYCGEDLNSWSCKLIDPKGVIWFSSIEQEKYPTTFMIEKLKLPEPISAGSLFKIMYPMCLSNYDCVEKGEIMVDGKKVKWMTGKNREEPVQYLSVFTIKGRDAYILNFCAETECFPKYLPISHSIAETFKLK